MGTALQKYGPQDGDKLAENFRRFAGLHTHGMTPLYRVLSANIAEDREILAMAAEKQPGQPAPNILFGAVHYLLLSGVAHQLGDYYPSISPDRLRDPSDPEFYPAFREYCLNNRQKLLDLIRSKHTQTNEVNRCSLLLPVFSSISAQDHGNPMAVIEIGPSAGLNLNWQRYRYSYQPGRTYGEPGSPLHLTCESRGAEMPAIPTDYPGSALVDRNLGIERNPLSLENPEDRLWLQALVWPDHLDRMDKLRAAIQIADEHPPEILPGDALRVLPEVLNQLPRDLVPVVFHTFVIYQLKPEQQAEFIDQLAEIGQDRRIHRVSVEWIGSQAPVIAWDTWNQGVHEHRELADCNPHGRWISWR